MNRRELLRYSIASLLVPAAVAQVADTTYESVNSGTLFYVPDPWKVWVDSDGVTWMSRGALIVRQDTSQLPPVIPEVLPPEGFLVTGVNCSLSKDGTVVGLRVTARQVPPNV